MKKFSLLSLPLLLMGSTGCHSDSTPGKSTYISYCASCHNANAKLPGSVGPAIYGTSFEVLERKVLDGTYPSGYKPKRDTATMPRITLSDKQLIEIYSYLHNSQEHK